MTRRYRKQQRAEDQARTRARIVEATVELHQEKGIIATSIADIAARAGVGKVTVYRHFPDETALVGACSGAYFDIHPLPDPEPWRAIADPHQRLANGLAVTCAYHRETAAMMVKVLPDLQQSPVIEPYRAHWRRVAEVLAEPWPGSLRNDPRFRAALALALEFDTWHLLTGAQGLTDAEAVELMLRLFPAAT